MATNPVDVDYLIIGAGAVGMAFADSLFTETDATMAIADRRDRSGGHWNDTYPFVRLHQPSGYYGVNSLELGSGRIDQAGLNAGLRELASGHEVVNHFDQTMRQRLLPSGRVHFFPMSEVEDDGAIVSRLSGERIEVNAARIVDGTWSQMRIPSMSPPAYDIAQGVDCVAVNELPRLAPSYDEYVVIGAGKTGMDACNWLLENGVNPDRVHWVMPRDSWVLKRGNFQPGEEFFTRFCQSVADQVEAVAEAVSIDDVFARLESAGELGRIDPDVRPTAYHCATLSDAELEALRTIRKIIRLGHVTAIDGEQIYLEQGTIPAPPNCLYVDCSAAGIPGKPPTPVFEGNRITPQWVRTCQPAFSAAFIAYVESAFDDEAEKNRICAPIAPPTVPEDWLRMLKLDLVNRQTWSQYPQLGEWIAAARLSPLKLDRASLEGDAEAAAHIGRYFSNVKGAQARLSELLPT